MLFLTVINWRSHAFYQIDSRSQELIGSNNTANLDKNIEIIDVDYSMGCGGYDVWVKLKGA